MGPFKIMQRSVMAPACNRVLFQHPTMHIYMKNVYLTSGYFISEHIFSMKYRAIKHPAPLLITSTACPSQIDVY